MNKGFAAATMGFLSVLCVLCFVGVKAQDLASAKSIIQRAGPLSAQDIPLVVKAVRAANSGKAFRAVGGLGGVEFQFGPDGRLRFTRQEMRGTMGKKVTITEYSDRAARNCNGTQATGTLVIEYSNVNGTWQLGARPSRDSEILAPAMQVYELPPSAILDGGFKDIKGRRARSLRFRYQSSAAVMEKFGSDTFQALYFDAESLLWLRWELRIKLPNQPYYGYDFLYDSSLDLRPPSDLKPPDCFTGQSLRDFPTLPGR